MDHRRNHICRRRSSLMETVKIESKVVLITGVSSGIGRETAQLLAERGARVFGTVRDLGRADPIAKVELVLMDVTDDKSVKGRGGVCIGKRWQDRHPDQQRRLFDRGRIGRDEHRGSASVVRHELFRSAACHSSCSAIDAPEWLRPHC